VTSPLFKTYKFKTWTDLLDRMLEERKKVLSELTLENNRRRLGEFTAWLDEQEVTAEDLTSANQAATVKAFIDGPKGRTKPRTRKGYVLLVHRFYVFASGGITGHPQYNVLPEAPKWKVGDKDLLKVPDDDAYCITKEQFETVIEKAAKDYSIRTLALVLVAGTAGLRREELCNLTWGDVTFDDDTRQTEFHVVAGKGNKSRRTPSLDPRCYRALLDLRSLVAKVGLNEPDHPVFLSGDFGNGPAALRPASVGAFFHQLTEGIGFRVTAHSLRHRCARTWHEGGASLMAIKQALGHADVATTQRYISVSEEDALAQLRGLGKGRQVVVPLPTTRAKQPQPIGRLAA